MSLRKVIDIYNTDRKFLYEIIEDYKLEQSKDKKSDILKSFYSLIWSNSNKRRLLDKTIGYKVNNNIQDKDIRSLFELYSNIKFIGYKRMTKEKDAFSLIRQKINNIYSNMFDSEICLKKDYMDCLKKPQELYYLYINGANMTYDFIKENIEESISKSIKLKDMYARQKMKLIWKDYKKVVEQYIEKIFNNCILLEEYEDKTKLTIDIDTWNEDNFYIKYICNCLNGNFKDYQKQYYGLPMSTRNRYSRCKKCGSLINIDNKKDNKAKYCDSCKKIKRKEINRNYYIKTNQKS